MGWEFFVPSQTLIILVGASLGGTLCHTHNPILGLFSCTCLHTTSDDNQTRPKHTTQRPTKHHHQVVEPPTPQAALI